MAFVPPRRVRVEGVGVGVREGENKRRGSEICSRSVVDPAVPGSAEKLPGRVICPGLNSIAQEPFATPVTLPEDISAASAIPNERQLSIRVWQRESVPRSKNNTYWVETNLFDAGSSAQGVSAHSVSYVWTPVWREVRTRRWSCGEFGHRLRGRCRRLE